MFADVIDLFLARAAANPDHPAIVTSDGAATYQQLELRVRVLAALFAKHSEPRVLIALPPSIDAYACMLASGLAGGFYTPINLASPVDKIFRIARQLEPTIVVAKPELLAKLKGYRAVMVDPVRLCTTAHFDGATTRHRLAYVLFTSGSTGEPKGVMISRQALGHYVAWLGTFNIRSEDRLSQQPNLAFDMSVTDIFGALCYGATLYPLDVEGDRLMPARFIQRNRITLWNSTPSSISLMMRAKQVSESHLKTLRLITLSGEPLLKEHLDALFAAVPDATIQNTYGPTEATVESTVIQLRRSNYEQHCRSSVALGDPLPGMDIILSGGPSGDEGEIVIVGPQLADGYWQNAAKTASAFRPISPVDSRRGYFTGDWAIRMGGDLYFKERIDFQVKIRGYRIELDEVAAAIRACGYPVACVVKVGETLAALVESSDQEANFNEPALRRLLAAYLEPHAIPERIFMIAHLPRNENDKLDRKAVADLLHLKIGEAHDQ
jgi:D-alanine--poly(phosphoribitol) ligase subunit 1